jgi:hypothetical protein
MNLTYTVNSMLNLSSLFFKPITSLYPVRNNDPCSAMGLGFRIIPAGFSAPLEFLTGFTEIRES